MFLFSCFKQRMHSKKYLNGGLSIDFEKKSLEPFLKYLLPVPFPVPHISLEIQWSEDPQDPPKISHSPISKISWNFRKWLNTSSVNSKETTFGDKIFGTKN